MIWRLVFNEKILMPGWPLLGIVILLSLDCFWRALLGSKSSDADVFQPRYTRETKGDTYICHFAHRPASHLTHRRVGQRKLKLD